MKADNWARTTSADLAKQEDAESTVCILSLQSSVRNNTLATLPAKTESNRVCIRSCSEFPLRDS